MRNDGEDVTLHRQQEMLVELLALRSRILRVTGQEKGCPFHVAKVHHKPIGVELALHSHLEGDCMLC